MRPKVLTLAPTVAADPDGISTSQTPAGGGVQSLTITGALASNGTVTFDVPRRVIVTSAGNESSRTFTVTGTDRWGQTITEAITGLNIGAAQSKLDFATVTGITTDANTAGAITAGTDETLSTRWFVPNRYSTDFQIAMAIIISGTCQVSIEHTLDDVLAKTVTPSSLFEVFTKGGMTDINEDAEGSYDNIVGAVRMTMRSYGGTTDTAELTIIPRGQ